MPDLWRDILQVLFQEKIHSLQPNSLIYHAEIEGGRFQRRLFLPLPLYIIATDLTRQVSCYVHWGATNPSPGRVEWEGYRDLELFFQMAQEVGLWVTARHGPYINGTSPFLSSIHPVL